LVTHKLTSEDDLEEPFTLLAIHCSEEDYKIAYLLNQHLKMRFKRKKTDLDFSTEGLLITFPIYDFEDEFNCTHFSLVANKCRSNEASLQSSGGLFSEMVSEKSTVRYLLPEFKNVDYLMKIHSGFEAIPLRKIISEINDIKQIISAYQIAAENIKSKNNLIFD
jgi:hypothetical protein